MPKRVILYIQSAVIGSGIAAVFVGMLLWFNVMNLWHLVSTSDSGLFAVGLLWFMFGIVFAGSQFGHASMSLTGNDTAPRRGMWITPIIKPEMVPVRVPAKTSTRKQIRR
ncbi:hypothetical protein [Phaeobacter sp. C3_T13_0]|uniref:hypothetical protein n=1 Tax=Phaeobacter cretensis TaxID=3342641 RepID=UPI0039BCA46F